MRFSLNSDPAAAPHAAGCSLDEAAPGQWLAVDEVVGEDALAQRLRACGLWPGALVEHVGRAPFGDPLLFKLHGFRLALRRSEAARVRARVLEPQP
ncbi:MAG: ferrous iron transport protein A [Planctomycetes bacterium]|nr:ferrous iron transport protein A [Planctomycetota bacterium]